ncbi:hypothetical protein LG288_11090 [Idiomarina seosinensis]|uniref:hypothetical protein n=1 Tax=Idiomarina seosinensis TaxID=281739 RepID=UPI00384EA2CF
MASNIKNSALAALVPVALIMMSFSGKAAAETATDDVQVYAGLSAVLKIECTDLNFGVWRVPLRGTDYSASAYVELEAMRFNADEDRFTTILDVPRYSDLIALTSESAAPQVAGCIVSGSDAVDGTEGTVSMPGAYFASGTTVLQIVDYMTPITSKEEYVFGDIGVPSNRDQTIPVTVKIYDDLDYRNQVIRGGITRFAVGGRLTLRTWNEPGDFGGYKLANPVAITFDDNVGD